MPDMVISMESQPSADRAFSPTARPCHDVAMSSVMEITERARTLSGMNVKLPPGSTNGDDPRANTILAALPEAEYARLRPRLEHVDLVRGVVLEAEHQEIHSVFFPVEGVASILAVGENGESVDTSMIGREGMTGLAVFLGTGHMPVRTLVQVPMRGLSAGGRRPSQRAGAWRGLVDLLHRYTQVVMVSMAQLILCNRAHRLDQRAARWLLQVDERVDEAPFDVTQEFLAEMIGTQRPSVSLAVRQFKDAA